VLGDNAADTELLRTLQVQLRKYTQLLNDAINNKATAGTIALLTKQRDTYRMQIADVSARLKMADMPSSGLVRLEEAANELKGVLKFGGWMIPLALLAGAAYFASKARGSQQW
jgi:hypothetical protein